MSGTIMPTQMHSKLNAFNTKKQLAWFPVFPMGNMSWIIQKLITVPGWPHAHVSAADSGCDPSDFHVMVTTFTGAHII